MIIFEARDLVKFFGGLSAVNEVGFQVEKGEIFGLIGPNGSGKTQSRSQNPESKIKEGCFSPLLRVSK